MGPSKPRMCAKEDRGLFDWGIEHVEGSTRYQDQQLIGGQRKERDSLKDREKIDKYRMDFTSEGKE